MPSLSYPGVYIQEIPSGVRTITGVATSITAFIGWANQGPIDTAQEIFSWQDFERCFGGLDGNSLLGYAVSSFFANGGTDAYVIRLADPTASLAKCTVASMINLVTKNPGAWGNNYSVTTKIRSDDATKFRLQVLSNDTGNIAESFENMSVNPNDARYVITVINEDSTILNATMVGTPTAPPADSTSPLPLSGGADGTVLQPNTSAFESLLIDSAGNIPLLEKVDLFNILCVPGETTPAVVSNLEGYCVKKRAFLIADCDENADFNKLSNGPDTSLTGSNSINAALYFPWLKIPDPLQENRPRNVPPCGFVAGIYSNTDANRGVFKAPAGVDASLSGILGVTEVLTDMQNGTLNQQAINCIRTFPVYGTVVWGARTLRGNDEIGSEWKYIPVKRMALFIEESLFRGTKWVVFEPNDEPLWAQIRLNIGAFMQNLFRQGAFQGSTPKEAYFVKCDKETTTQNDINLGIVNIIVGFAPLKPAEFVVISIQQIAGEIQT
jgi:phage tail sheath protein FI